MKLFKEDLSDQNLKRILGKKSKLTWRESYILHLYKYVESSKCPNADKSKLNYHLLCMKRAEQHVNGVKKGDIDLRNKSSNSLFGSVKNKK